MAVQDTLNLMEHEALGAIERQEWLEPISEGIAQAVTGAFGAAGSVGPIVEDFLNGVWLGHPLHPVLVEVPIGAWTATLVLDALDAASRRKQFAPGADATLAIGLVGALAAAASGLSQWQYTEGSTRRKGMLHALLNVGAIGLYTASLALRLRGARRAGAITSLVGFVGVMASSWLGGDLVYGDLLGTDHAPQETPPDEFTAILAERELTEGATRRVQIGTLSIVLARQHGHIYALADACSHLAGPLSEGTLEEGCITCPWHQSQFALSDGRVLRGPATYPQPHYETRVRDGQIEVRNSTQFAR